MVHCPSLVMKFSVQRFAILIIARRQETTKVVNSSCEQATNLTLTGPLVVNYLWARIKLLEKHHICLVYRDYDINIKWDHRKWAAEGEGYLYSEEYDDLNKAVARGGVTDEEQAEEVLKYTATLPTVIGVNYKGQK